MAAIAVIVSAVRCGDVNTALQHQSEARHLAADLHVQFTKATDASNRAVMANSDETAQAAARDAEQAKLAVQTDLDALQAILSELEYTNESRLLESFVTRFAEYRTLDRRILDLVVEQTNLKAQRLAFGPANEAAEAMRTALDALTPAAAGNAWHVKALAATAVASMREIQAMHGPHIADTEDAAMDAKEKRMAAAAATVAELPRRARAARGGCRRGSRLPGPAPRSIGSCRSTVSSSHSRVATRTSALSPCR